MVIFYVPNREEYKPEVGTLYKVMENSRRVTQQIQSGFLNSVRIETEASN